MGLPPGAVECKPDGHLLLGAVWDELGVGRCRGEGLGSAARHAGEGRRSPEVSSRGGGELSEVVRLWSRERMGRNICGVGWASVGRVRCGRHARVPPYLPHIWVGYEGCLSARAFEAHLRPLVGSKFCDRLVTGRPIWAFGEDLGCPAIYALTGRSGYGLRSTLGRLYTTHVTTVVFPHRFSL